MPIISQPNWEKWCTMNKADIITEIGKDKVVEGLISNYSNDKSLLKDLSQEIYLILLEYDEDTIVQAYNRNELTFLIYRIAKNQFFSNTSPFYYNETQYIMDKRELRNVYITKTPLWGDSTATTKRQANKRKKEIEKYEADNQ